MSRLRLRGLTIGPLFIGSAAHWRYAWVMRRDNGWCGIFRNLPHVRPGRWGFWFLAIEFGSRNPGDRFGLWLKRWGLWPW